MRIMHCECTVVYTGRGDTTLPRHDRVIIMKDDGAVMIHSDEGIKPLNYMTAKPKITINKESVNGEENITFESNKESLTVTIHDIKSDIELKVSKNDPGLIHDGTEDQLQEWLYNNLSRIIPYYTFVQREFSTENGPVDLLAFNNNTNKYVLIEVKRIATTAAVHQLKRYIEGVEDNPDIVVPERLLIALKVAPKGRERAAKLDTPWIELEKNGDDYVLSNFADIDGLIAL